MFQEHKDATKTIEVGHEYLLTHSSGYNPELQATEFSIKNGASQLRFLTKEEGRFLPGITTEQVLHVLIDRHTELNNRFPSEFNVKLLEGLNMALTACHDRVVDRQKRNVMGELKK